MTSTTAADEESKLVFFREWKTEACEGCGKTFPLSELWTNGDTYCKKCMDAQINEWEPFLDPEELVDCGHCKKKVPIANTYQQFVNPHKKSDVYAQVFCKPCAIKINKDRMGTEVDTKEAFKRKWSASNSNGFRLKTKKHKKQKIAEEEEKK